MVILDKIMHFKNQDDYKVWADQQEKGAIGGGIFTPDGPEDYVEQSLPFVLCFILRKVIAMKCVKPLLSVLMIIKSMPKII